MPTFSAPDVYVQEIKVFPPSVAEVETAIPAFIGYTQKARKDADNDLILKPTRIYSMTQFEEYFGKTRSVGCDVTITEVDGVKQARITAPVPPIPGYVFFPDYLLVVLCSVGGGHIHGKALSGGLLLESLAGGAKSGHHHQCVALRRHQAIEFLSLAA